ncbi:MAG: GWxTD domain-containing protein [Acidobacteriota bacterium]|nr:GWxTD domain-containing protein [Acidobacteriota bacterium]
MKKTNVLVLALLLVFVASCGVQMLPSRDSWYAKHYFIMKNYERETYKKLTDEGRQEFQQLFWQVRQPLAKEQFDERIAYIERIYKSENRSQPWNTDRGRIYLLNGPPASIDYKQNTDWVMTIDTSTGQSGSLMTERNKEDIQATTAEIWTYPYDKYFVYYIFTFAPPSTWKLSPSTYQNNPYLEGLETLNKDLIFGVVNEEEYKYKLSDLTQKK